MDDQKESNTESLLASGEETSTKEQSNGTRRNITKKRRRPRTKALRCQLKDLLEKTILGKEQHLPDDLFSTLNDGILVAPLSSIFVQIQLIFPKLAISKFEQLSPLALKSVSKITRIFRITDKLPTKSNQKEEYLNEENQQLWLLINPKQRSQHEERTVYVDNLPLNCTRSLLERRCTQFGSVVSILLPQTSRIQRRLVQSSNVNSVHHSGFAFVQFASKTAAKRFCKRYQLNSRLKRTHHSHGHRHKRAKLFTKQNLSHFAMLDDLTMKDSLNEKIGEKEETHSISTQLDEKTTNSSSFVVPQIPSLTEISRTRMRSQSVAESIMSVDESGKETDLEEKQNGNSLQKGIKKHRRRRKPRPTTTNRANHIYSLNSLFRHIQVFPFKQYKELRTNYLKLKKEKMSVLKTKIKENKKINKNQTVSKENNNGEKEENKRNNEKNKIKKSKKRKRGIRRLMDAAELVKLETLK
ncbi:hypothetical protein ACQ4LE_007922 [Meloidogyne hapla]